MNDLAHGQPKHENMIDPNGVEINKIIKNTRRGGQWDDNNDALRSSARRRMVPVSVGIRIGVVSRSRARFLPSLQTRLPDEQRLDRLGRRSGPLPMLGTIRGLRSRNRPLHRLPREHGRRPLPIVRCRILRRSISGGWMQALLVSVQGAQFC